MHIVSAVYAAYTGFFAHCEISKLNELLYPNLFTNKHDTADRQRQQQK